MDEVRQRWAANAKRAGGVVQAARPVTLEGPAVPPAGSDRVPTADPSETVAHAEGLLRSMAARLEEALAKGQVHRDDVEAVVKAVDTVRKAHKDYPEIRKRRGELVERDQVVSEMGELVLLLTGGMERCEANVPTRLLQLVDDPEWGAKPVKVRVLEVQKVLRDEFDRARSAMAERARA